MPHISTSFDIQVELVTQIILFVERPPLTANSFKNCQKIHTREFSGIEEQRRETYWTLSYPLFYSSL